MAMLFLVLREYENGQVSEESSIAFSDNSKRLTIGRASYADIQIGAKLPIYIQQGISRIQATLYRNEDDSISIVDGDAMPSRNGIYLNGLRITDRLTILPNQKIVLFDWHKTIESQSDLDSAKIELDSTKTDIPTYPPHEKPEDGTVSSEWHDISDQVYQLSITVKALEQALNDHREVLEQTEVRITDKMEALVSGQFAEVKSALTLKQELDKKQSSDITRIMKQVRLFVLGVGTVLVFSVLITAIKGASDKDRDGALEKIRGTIPIVVAIVLGVNTLRSRKKK